MLTVRFDELGVQEGDLLLDMGCGAGRHAFESFRRGARVVAFDYSAAELKDVAGLFAAMREAGEAGTDAGSLAVTTNGDALKLPFPDDAFDRIIASEVLEHVSDDQQALHEIFRVLKPGGTLAATVPAWLPEQICWALSEEYHAPFVEGGHVRIYSEPTLRDRMRRAGLKPGAAHHAHALHSPYWWLKCAVGPTNDDHPLVKGYLQVLVWDIMQTQPMGTITRWAEKLLNPVLGKSLIVYARKPVGKA
ncbi:MAG TPA: class I SAM-dependent methyltransferase [Acidimicrobiales bacterium]|nr:class I SAM-dependent methyltransferase [Acidimicrobiales bacterium]